MAADFPIGTRMNVNSRILEIVEDSPDAKNCDECALKGWGNGLVGAMIYPRTLCQYLVCKKNKRADGKNVHWELKDE